MTKKELQGKIDIQKWLESENQHKDMCGHYGYCDYCDPIEEYPCASAQVRMVNNGKKPTPKPFSEKLKDADETVKERYNLIKEALLAPKKGAAVKSKINKKCESFYKGKELIAKITIIGKSLKIYLALPPDDDALGKYPHRDASGIKEYSEVPFQIKLSSDISVKRCIKLISMLKQ